MTHYRDRFYDRYVHARCEALAPETIDGLKPRAPYLRRLVRRYFPIDREARILDLGCGHGAMLFFAQEAGYANVRGIDRSPEQVTAARRLGITVEQGDFRKALAEEGDASVDVVITYDVIEHFTREELIPIVDGIHRVLKPGGRWIIHTPNGESPFGGRSRYGDLTHELAFTRTSLGQLLYASGFSHVESAEEAPIPHGVVSLARAILWRTIRMFLVAWIAIETGVFDRRGVFTQNFVTIAVK